MKKTLIILLIILLIWCTSNQVSSQDNILPAIVINSRYFDVGVAGMIWKGYPNQSDQDFLDFLNELQLVGEYVGLYIKWDDPGLLNQVNLVNTYSNVKPLLAIGFNHEDVNETYFQTIRDDYKNVVLEAVNTYDLDYLGIGVEVNRVRDEHSPESFNEFVDLYKEIYDKVKIASPNTKVFTIFQLDYMRGASYLSGLNLKPSWDIIDLFEPKLDLVGLTVYPFLNYSSTSQIPINYFTEINSHTNKPIIITESGWMSEDLVAHGVHLVDGSEEEQVSFISSMLNSTHYLNLEVLMYSFLYEYTEDIDLFHHVALRKNSGEAKQAYYYWRALAETKKE
jgi:hypothetical protein